MPSDKTILPDTLKNVGEMTVLQKKYFVCSYKVQYANKYSNF